MRLLVTVGTTAFDRLIGLFATPRILAALHVAGITQLVLQYGGSDAAYRQVVRAVRDAQGSVRVSGVAYTPSLEEEMASADAVVSHAGAGCVMEALRHERRVLVVVNDALMDNHQAELAMELHARGHVVATLAADAEAALETWLHALARPKAAAALCTPLPPAQPEAFAALLAERVFEA